MVLFLLLLLSEIKNPNIIIITLDTLRKDHISFYGKQNASTPMLDEFAKESMVFQDATTSVPLTLPAHFTLFTGLYPLNHGVRDNGEIYKINHPLMAEVLKKYGYSTFAFISSDVLNRESNIFIGFDGVYSNLNSITGEASCFETLELFNSKIENLKKSQPIFLWVHFFDPHFPYMPQGITEINTKNAYKKEVENLDYCFGKLHNLILSSIDTNNIFVVLSDHGESLEENGEKTHGYYIFEPTIQIPLFIKFPDINKGTISGQVSIIDIYPTVLSYLKINYGKVDGINLLPTLKGKGKLKERELIIESYHLYKTFGLMPFIGLRKEGIKAVLGYSLKFYQLKKGKEEEVFLDKKARDNYFKKLVEIKNKTVSEESAMGLKSLGYVNPFGGKVTIQREEKLEDIVKKSEDIIGFTLTGREFLRWGNYEESIKYFDKSLSLQPGFTDALVYKSLALIMKGEPLKAMDVLDNINLKNDFILYLYGWANLRLGKGAKAEPYFRKALDIRPEQLEYKIGLGKSLLLQGKFSEGEAILKEVLKKDENNIDAKMALEELYRILKNEKKRN